MRYAAVVLFSFLLLASSALSLQTPQSPNASIEGVVTRVDTSAPVAGVQVTLTALNPLAAAFAAGADPALIEAMQAGQTGPGAAQPRPQQLPPVTSGSVG